MKEYKVTVPFMNLTLTEENLPNLLAELKRAKADRILITWNHFYYDEERREKTFAEAKRLVEYFRANSDFEIGIWIWSSRVEGAHPFTYKTNEKGEPLLSWVCHSDERFVDFAADYIENLAKAAPDLIMFNDDFHYYAFCGCRCEVHRRRFAEKFGAAYDFDTVDREAFEGGPNQSRELWMDFMGDELANFAARMRQAVDKVDPRIRMGISANQSNYGTDGILMARLLKIFAGNTRPITRTVGAPYWPLYYKTYELPTVFEYERQQAAELAGEGIETMSEGDIWPSPRTDVPAALLECFDTVLRADGTEDGIQKYMLDLLTPVAYETGYVDRHVANQPLYESIHKHFSEKPAAGVRVYHSTRVYREFDVENAYGQGKFWFTHRLSNSLEGRVLTLLGIPTTYEGRGIAGVAFGDQAKFLDDEALQSGIITDLPGAMALTARGIDVGLREVKGHFTAGMEGFGDEVFHTLAVENAPRDASFFAVVPDEKAVIDSYYYHRHHWFTDEIDTMEKTPAAYRYENAAGQRFFVMAFAGNGALQEREFKSYAKSKQLAEACEWVGRKPLPAKCEDHVPNLYMLCKQDENSLSVGLWNLCADEIPLMTIVLEKAFDHIEFINCSGKLEGRTVTLSEIGAYKFAGIVGMRWAAPTGNP